MKQRISILVVFTLLFACNNFVYAQEKTIDDLISDLASPLQSTRDKAAIELRSSYKSSPISKWDSVLERIKKGQTKNKLLDHLAEFSPEVHFSIGSGRTHSVSYELDNDWILTCWFENEGDILMSWDLGEQTKSIWVPPTDKKFTGKWITYFVNGEKANEIDYKDGTYFGEFISYHSDGSKSYVQHYTDKGCNGTDIGYYPSGKVKYEGEYKNGKQIGTWTWYDENGEITSQREEGEK